MSLVTNDLNDRLTQIDPDLERKRRQTFPGMAHFAGSGPANRTCLDCVFWTGMGRTGYYSAKGLAGGLIKPRACAKYKEMMNGQVGKEVPDHAAACRYFEGNPKPPARYSR